MTTQHAPIGQEKKLSSKQREAALLLAQGVSIAKAAGKVGCNEKTVDLWKHKPEFMEAIRTAEDALYNESLQLLKRSLRAAVVALIGCLAPEVSDYVRVQAAGKLLDKAIEINTLTQLSERLHELEERLKEHDNDDRRRT